MKKCRVCDGWQSETYVIHVIDDKFVCLDCAEELVEYTDLYRKEKL